MFTVESRNALVGIVAAVLWLGAGCAAAADAPRPVKIAVSPFELEDHGPAAKGGEAPHLAQATEEAKKQLVASGRYMVVDATAAEQVLTGVISRISNTEYLVKLQITDARSGEVISKLASELRMGADYSWSRGVRSVILNNLLAAPAQPPGD
jgi:hypothetical protein